MSRFPERDMVKSYGNFETLVKLVDQALKSSKTRVLKLNELRAKLETSYFALDETFRLYKLDHIEKVSKSLLEFNALDDDGKAKVPTNDEWADKQMAVYVQWTESLEDKIEELAAKETPMVGNTKVQEDPQDFEEEIKFEEGSVKQSVESFVQEVTSKDVIGIASAGAYEKYSEKLKYRLEMLRTKARRAKSESKTRSMTFEFCDTESAKLDSAMLHICTKIPEPAVPPPASPAAQSSRTYAGKEQIHLEKSKPPKFKGDETEYPEFKRKWLSIVSNAHLPEESEVDKLRDAIPADAKDLLYGVVTTAKAWDILDKRFGDPKIISMKLKNQLKSIQAEGDSDPGRVISLVIKVRTIVIKLESLNMQGALVHDTEFLSAVYCALPDKHQTRWLDYTKTSNHWEDLMKFLESAYSQATEEMSLLATYKSDAEKKVKLKGKETPSRAYAVNVTGDSKQEEETLKDKAYKRSQEFCGKCPLCSQNHTWIRQSGDKWPSDRFLSCKKFNDMTAAARAKAVEKCKGCPRCTSWSHSRDKCKMPSNNCNKEDTAGTKCKGDHSKLLCGSGNAYCFALNAVGSLVDANEEAFKAVDELAMTVFYLQDIPVAGHDVKARTFWDDGSNRVLITEEFGLRLGLVKKEIRFALEAVNHEVEYRTGHIFLLSLVDMHGVLHDIWGYSVDKIMLSSTPDMSAMQALFPHVPMAAFRAMQAQEVDILIGLNMSPIMPEGGSGIDKVGGMKALKSIFEPGWVVGGLLDSQDSQSCNISSQAALVRSAKMLIMPEPALSPDFWESDQLGVKPVPKCDRCRRCQQTGECSESHVQHTLKDQAGLDLIKAKTKLINGEIWCDYPFTRDPACLPNNRTAAVRVAEKVWKDLQKDNMLEKYHEQVQQLLDRNTAVKLSKQEMEEYSGPAQYISHHGVCKESVSTPLQMVTNSSFNNGGCCLNACLAAGPNSLNPMLPVMMRFRCRECGLQYDLSKAYNTMRTGPRERHLRRFVWKFREEDEWQDFAFDRVHFGDCCAACQLEVAKDLLADTFSYIDPEAAQRVKDDVYVDDGVTGGTPEQVDRFLGVKTDDGSFNGTIPQILGGGNFKFKAAVRSGDTDEEQIAKLGNNVFGYYWNVTEDMLGVRFNVNLSKKKRGIRSEPNLNVDDIKKLETVHLCKRNLLGFMNGFCDSLGIASPWYMKSKLMMQELFLLEQPLSWDDPIPAGNRAAWISVMVEALEQGVLDFPRCTRPVNAVGMGPRIVGFGDGALPGFGGCVYTQWEVDGDHEAGYEGEGGYEANLLIAKARVCPLRGYTVSRSELCGALVVSRLLLAVITAMFKMEEAPIGVVMLLDTRCVISALELTSTKLMPFFQNRLAEIHENLETIGRMCEVEPVHWVQTDLNPADLLTRGNVHLQDLGPNTFYQKGPKFLSSSRESWPVTRSFVPIEIPEDEVRPKAINFVAALRATLLTPVQNSSVQNPIKTIAGIARYSNCLAKVHRILARVTRGWGLKDMKKIITDPKALTRIAAEPTSREISKGKELILLYGMLETVQAQAEGKLVSLMPAKRPTKEFKDGYLIVTSGRLGERGMSRLLGVDSLPILMPGSQVAYLYMLMAHHGESGLSNTAVEHHRGATGTLARSRTYVWVVRGKDLAKKIVKNCPKCRIERRRLQAQQMGLLKENQLTVCPPWTFVSLDFAGPFMVSGEVQKRTRMKCWVLVYCCQSTRAVCLLLTAGYSTSDFLCKHDEFCSRKGIPRKITSDRGSQLVAGSITVARKDLPDQAYDWSKVTRENKCSNWEFVPIGCQWRNQTEAMVKIFKKALVHALPAGKVLGYSEMVTLLARISFSVNSRPLALGDVSGTSQQEDSMMPLTANQLLLAHNTAESPAMEYEEDDRFSARLNFVSSVHREWWERWIEEVLPTLIPCRKWKNQMRNLRVGDVVMMVYQGNLVNDYRLAMVTGVFPDKKGLVRTVKVSYRKKMKNEAPEVYRSKPLVEEKVGVQRLALLQGVGEEHPNGLN